MLALAPMIVPPGDCELVHWLEWHVITIRLLIGDDHFPVSFLGEDFLLLIDKPEAEVSPDETTIRLSMHAIQED